MAAGLSPFTCEIDLTGSPDISIRATSVAPNHFNVDDTSRWSVLLNSHRCAGVGAASYLSSPP